MVILIDGQMPQEMLGMGELDHVAFVLCLTYTQVKHECRPKYQGDAFGKRSFLGASGAHCDLQGYQWENLTRKWSKDVDAEQWLYRVDNLWIDQFANNMRKLDHQSRVRRRKWKRVAVDTRPTLRGCTATRGCAVNGCMIQ